MHSSATNSQDSSDDSHRKSNLSDYTTGTTPKFKFPPIPRISKSVNNSVNNSYVSSQSDSSNSTQNFRKSKRKNKKVNRLPPLGIFWDIENCQVPKNKSASAVVQRIREFFLEKYREAEFLVVCDVKKERPQVIQELHDSQVNLIHVASTSKNAADEKLRQSLRRFAEVYPAPSSVVLISGDINFAADLSDLRYRKKIRVILVHNANVADALVLCANEHYCYSSITEGIPKEKTKGQLNDPAFLLVSNLPTTISATTLKNRLNFLCNNCGGRVVEVQQEEGLAYIKFSSQDFANRAQKRIQGEDVFGNKIKAVTPSLRSYTGRKIKSDGTFQGHQFSSTRGLPQEPLSNFSTKDNKRFSYQDMGQDFRSLAGSTSLMDVSYGTTSRRSRTPQDAFKMISGRVHRTSGSSEYSDDGKFQTDNTKTSQPVDLIISNLDPTINVKELRRLLTNMLKEYAMVLSLNIVVQTDGTPVANIRVNNQQSAQFIISQLHRQKLGHKRIVISYAQSNSPDPEQLKAMVISILQIMGDGTRKIITLSHQAQMRRFTSDLLRVLKVQPSKQISINDFPSAYEKVMNKAFNSVDYGLCTFQDLLDEVPENIIVITQINENAVISVPKREQTAKEIMRTKQFAMEVIDILRHSPNCTMLFNKFVPAYHHHFGHQCRVADYGFTKLIELFEAIPDVVKIQEISEGERTVSLTLHQSLKVLGSQITNLIKNSPSASIPLNDLPRVYLKECGYPLKPQVYDCRSISELIERMSDYIQILETGSGLVLVSVDSDSLSVMKVRSWALLLKSPYCKDFATFKYEYQSRYNSDILLNDLKQLRNVVSLSTNNDTNYIALTDLYILAAQLYHVLYVNGGSVLFSNLERVYAQTFGNNLRLLDYNINAVDELYEKFEFLFFMRAYKKSVLVLNRNLSDYQVALPAQIYNSNTTKKWPPPPSMQKMVLPGAGRKISPPKPDTPPTPTTSSWTSLRRNQSLDADLSLSIQLPIIQNPQLLGNPYDLISPARHLFSLNRNPWAKAPDPTELPMPDKLIMKGIISDDSTDSGVNSKLENSPSDNELEPGACGSGAKRRLTSYLSFDK